jgi:hypothetical protein
LVVCGPRRNQLFFFTLACPKHGMSPKLAQKNLPLLKSNCLIPSPHFLCYLILLGLAWLCLVWCGLIDPYRCMHFSHAQYQNFIRINSLDFSVHLFISFSLIKLKSNKLASYSQSCHYNWIKKKKSQSHWRLQQW